MSIIIRCSILYESLRESLEGMERQDIFIGDLYVHAILDFSKPIIQIRRDKEAVVRKTLSKRKGVNLAAILLWLENNPEFSFPMQAIETQLVLPLEGFEKRDRTCTFCVLDKQQMIDIPRHKFTWTCHKGKIHSCMTPENAQAIGVKL